MTDYFAEASRLGLPSPLFLPTQYGTRWNPVVNGLHVTGCKSCRTFRNSVRDALTAEAEAANAYAKAIMWAGITDEDLLAELTRRLRENVSL